MSISYEFIELRASKACHLTCFFWPNGTVCGLTGSEAGGVNCDFSTSSFSRRLRLMDSPARKELNRARLVFAMSGVNADVRGLQRTTARVDGYSDSRGH